jgi:hypothetical protein
MVLEWQFHEKAKKNNLDVLSVEPIKKKLRDVGSKRLNVY